MSDQKKAWRLKVGIATLITAVNISVYCIWIPARLQISHKYIWINEWWDRCEKVIYLLVDGALNFYFIHIVRVNLVLHGLTKYKRLVHFNMFIIGFSLSMDVLIIAMMSLKNTFVYVMPSFTPTQAEPLDRTIKANTHPVTCNFTPWPTWSNLISKCQWPISSERSPGIGTAELSRRGHFPAPYAKTDHNAFTVSSPCRIDEGAQYATCPSHFQSW